MKVVVTAKGTDLDSGLDPRFGRAENFIVVDTDTMEFELIKNDGINAMHGAGIQAAQFVSDKGIAVLITGNVGPNAQQTLQAAGVKVYQMTGNTVKDAVEAFIDGKLKEITQAGPAHAGMGRRGN